MMHHSLKEHDMFIVYEDGRKKLVSVSVPTTNSFNSMLYSMVCDSYNVMY